MINLFIYAVLLSRSVAQTFDCTQPPVNYKDNRNNISEWSLLQYNVEWLFTEPCSSCPGICTWSDPSDQYTHLNTIQQIIRTIDADTIHMVEVQSCTQLDEVKPDSIYNAYLIQGKDTYTEQNVGLLTKIDPITPLYRTEEKYSYPIMNSLCGYNGTSSTEGVSKNLYTDFIMNGLSIRLIGAHLLSNPNDPLACAKREAQAQVLQSLIYESVVNKKEVVMIGDLNDYDNNIEDMNGNIPNSIVLDILKGNKGEYTNYTLYSVGEKVKKKERYTEWYDVNENCVDEKEEYSAIDHILVSKALYSLISEVKYEHLYNEECETYQSDHFPLLVKFIFT